jgi:hypothetical protein
MGRTCAYFGEELGLVRAIKRQAADAHAVQNDAARPHVDRASVVALAGHDLGGAVGGGAADGLEQLAGHHVVAEAKVGEFHVELVVEPERSVLRQQGGAEVWGAHDVLRLEIAMRDVLAVAIVDGR